MFKIDIKVVYRAGKVARKPSAGWVRRRRQLWKGGGSAQQAGCWPLWGHLPWGTGEDGGWVPALSMHFFSFHQLRLRLEGDTPEVRLQWPLPPPTIGLHLAGHCCLAVGARTWSLTSRGGASAQTSQCPPLSGMSGAAGNRKGAPGLNRGPERCHPLFPDASVRPLEAKALKYSRPGLLHPFTHCLQSTRS